MSYAEIAAIGPSDRYIPPAFLCSASKEIMDDPHLALCGHLFEKAVLATLQHCPKDQYPINSSNTIPFAELKERISTWKSDRKAKEVTEELSSLSIVAESSSLHPYHVIRNAHQDDIHGFVRLSSTQFVSGSKDTSLKIWDTRGSLMQSISGDTVGYKYWVTALASFPRSNLWASGTRDGHISFWDLSGNRAAPDVRYLPGGNAICKNRNLSRILCIKECPPTNGETLFYTGTPKFLQLWNLDMGKMINYYQASLNDWVYCIEVLKENNLLVVIGPDLEKWTLPKQMRAAPKKVQIIHESWRRQTHQRQPYFISAIARLEGYPNVLSAALFNGTVRLIDFEKNQSISTLVHMKDPVKNQFMRNDDWRVWSLVNLNSRNFASSAEDGTIKVWDIRQQDPVITISNQSGRVSCLLTLQENIFISAACPTELHSTSEKATISFWDLRKFLNRLDP